MVYMVRKTGESASDVVRSDGTSLEDAVTNLETAVAKAADIGGTVVSSDGTETPVQFIVTEVVTE